MGWDATMFVASLMHGPVNVDAYVRKRQACMTGRCGRACECYRRLGLYNISHGSYPYKGQGTWHSAKKLKTLQLLACVANNNKNNGKLRRLAWLISQLFVRTAHLRRYHPTITRRGKRNFHAAPSTSSCACTGMDVFESCRSNGGATTFFVILFGTISCVVCPSSVHRGVDKFSTRKFQK